MEFHTHGSKAVQAKFLEELASIENFRMAEPVRYIVTKSSKFFQGEFTKRAFFNGKMDLMKVSITSVCHDNQCRLKDYQI